MECLLGKMMNKIMNRTDWKLIKESLDEWFPFNEDQTTAIKTVPNLETSSNQSDAHQYHISFKNLTIKIIPGYSNPKEIRCEFPNNLTVS